MGEQSSFKPLRSPAKASKSAKKAKDEEEEEDDDDEEEAPKKKAAPKAGKKADSEEGGKRGRKPAADPIPEKKFKNAYEAGDKVKFTATARQEGAGYTPGKPITATVVSFTRCPRTGQAYYKLEFKDKNTKEICRTQKLESAILTEE